jgi:hypothetical protein
VPFSITASTCWTSTPGLALGLQHVDRRLPVRAQPARRLRPEDLMVHAFGLRQHLQRFRPHPVSWIAF